MKSKDRFVLDTNVLVSAVLIDDSKSAQAFHRARHIGEILSSVAVAEELNDVLGREKFVVTLLVKSESDSWSPSFKGRGSLK